ncbi:MATE family efflux transporter [Clostridium peptidivorans]|uniref:MATE family efflux transporter n=1 Tax=Clostridium peptidivorans TaxID=100174 RepID=UPI000BE285DE|nr:MATE family efflux transporter [Clostridium peptidivorans]
MNSQSHSFFSDLINDKKFKNNLLKLALPITIQNFLTSSLNMIDTVIIGRLGEKEIAAVGIANQYYFLFNLLILGIVGGCGIFISQFWGKRDIDHIKKFLGLGFLGLTVLSTIFTLIALIFPKQIVLIFNSDPMVIEHGVKFLRIVSLSYIFTAISFNYACASRCVGKAMVPMIISAIAVLINAILNIIFVFGYFGISPMGVSGSALATLIARIIEATIMIIYIYKTHGVLASSLKDMFNFDLKLVKSSSKIILPVILNEACWALGNIAYVVAYGKIGTEALATVQITSNIQNLFMVVNLGVANAASVMIGNAIGACEENKGKLYGRRFAFISISLGIIMGGMLAISSPAIINFFKVSSEVRTSGIYILYIISATMFLKMFNTVFAIGILQGGGDSKYSFKLQMATLWGIGVPLAFIGALFLKLPVHIVVAIVCIQEVVNISIAIPRLLCDKWVRNVTECVA